MKDYKAYSTQRNITFVGICTSTTANLKTMEQQIGQFNLKPFANMLDAGGATAAAYNVPKSSPFWLVVIDGKGKIAYNASKGWTWSGGPNAGKFVHQTQIEASLKENPDGIIGARAVPEDLKAAGHYYDLQQFDLLEVELRKAEAKSASAESKGFAEYLRGRIAESRRARRLQIETLAKAEPVQAYREAIAFVAAFPKAPERAEVNDLGKELQKSPEVKREIAAEGAYQASLVPELKRTTTFKRFKERIEPLLAGYLKGYGDTQYGKAVKTAVEAHRLAVLDK